jgi:hypothetical protein
MAEWAEFVERVKALRKAYTIFVGKQEEKNNSKDKGVGGRITLKRVLGNQGRDGRIGFIWLRVGTGGGLFWAW